MIYKQVFLKKRMADGEALEEQSCNDSFPEWMKLVLRAMEGESEEKREQESTSRKPKARAL